MKAEPELSSFRDRDGFVFYSNNKVYRAISHSYLSTWELLQRSGLLQQLITEKKLVSFGDNQPDDNGVIVECEKIPFISYPGEWTFQQLKKAALLTLDIQLRSLEKGFSLKDASAYNVQFIGRQPVFIDLLSFDQYKEGSPWVAYGQFCRHFLAPLLMMHYGLPSVQSMFTGNLDGIPLELCAATLPFSSRFNLLAASHIHLHAKFLKKHAADRSKPGTGLTMSKRRLTTMLTHLRDSIKDLKAKKNETNWTGYYEDFSYSGRAFESKKDFVSRSIAQLKPDLCLDLGSNTGEFSLIAAGLSKYVVACDNDIEVVAGLNRKKLSNVLALYQDLSNPTPSFGWQSTERVSFMKRASKCDLAMALALIHHLCIGNNVPLVKTAEFFAFLAPNLIIEFVPKQDPQVKKLLVTRRDIFSDYTEAAFRDAFSRYFTIQNESSVPDSDRKLFLMQRKENV